MFNRSLFLSCRNNLVYNGTLCKWERPTVLCQLCYRTRALEWFNVSFVPLFLFVLIRNYEWLEQHLTSAPSQREKRLISGLEQRAWTQPKDKANTFQAQTTHSPSERNPPRRWPSPLRQLEWDREREKNKFIKPHRLTQLLIHNVTLTWPKITHRLSILFKALWYLHLEQCSRWISISLDITFGTATDTAHLQEWNKMFQVIFYNPKDWTQLPCNKLMDTVKIFGHFTVAVNGIFHTTLGSNGVGFTLFFFF